MVYGPVDLSQATAAEMDFYFWLYSECTGDNCATAVDPLEAIASTDGYNFHVVHWWAGAWAHDPSADPNGWVAWTLDLNSYAGQPQVWIGFIFASDNSVEYPGGAYVDDVLVRAYTGGTPTPTPTLTNTPTPTRTPTQTPTPTSTPGWITLVSTDFEGSFPGPWQVYDNNGTSYGEYYWGKRTCKAYAGSYSGWSVGGGANGASLACGSNYPDNADSWMVYGPFSLVGATAGDLRFKLWLNSESDNDKVCREASINGTNFYGTCTSGSTSGWVDKVLDLTNVYTLGNLMGQSNVWVALIFSSNSSVNDPEGGYVDDITLRVYMGSPPQTGLRIYLPVLMKRWSVLVPDTPTPTRTPTLWCDPYEPNNDRYTNPWGPLQSGQSYQAKLCAGDAEDNYYFDVGTTNPVQIRLQLPGSLVNHTSIWLYAQSNLGQTICGTGPVTTADYNIQCPISQTGRYIIRLYTDGASDNVNSYTLRAIFQ
jgi:hypothetical protein